MKKAWLNLIENQVSRFRMTVGLSDTEAVNLKSLLLKLNVLTLYRPLSSSFFGMSLRRGEKRFMLVNANQPRCRQHFTIAHELYHLFIEAHPTPHCCGQDGKKSESEQYADAFAQMFLMPDTGVKQLIPDEELRTGQVSMASILRIEHYFSVSHSAVLNRLFDLSLLNRAGREAYASCSIKRTARAYGYATTLYEPGNHGLVIGDFGEKARKLYEKEKISEGHYHELLHKIGINGNED